jgi:hypothetical protein
VSGERFGHYLTLSADYLEPSVHDDQGTTLSLAALNLPAELVDRIRRWNEAYQLVIPATAERRSELASEIAELDKVGLGLARELSSVLGGAKIRYFSEGLLRPLIDTGGDDG